MRNFIIFALPRSRTYWLSQFLACAHDPSLYFEDKSSINEFFKTQSCVDTFLASIWEEVLYRAPGVHVITVRRPVDEVLLSLKKLGLQGEQFLPKLQALDDCLNQIEAYTHCPRFTFAGLAQKRICEALYFLCKGHLPHPDFWEFWAAQNLQVDVQKILKEVALRRETLRKVYGDV